MRKILAIDPGSEQSAWVYVDGGRPVDSMIVPNAEILEWLSTSAVVRDPDLHVAIEMIASYGMPVGAEVFETCVWIGRFMQAIGPDRVQRILRKDVKMALCGKTAGVNDAVIRQRLIDIYGPGREKAIGTKKAPGPLYTIKADVWAALAVAVAYEAGRQPARGMAKDL